MNKALTPSVNERAHADTSSLDLVSFVCMPTGGRKWAFIWIPVGPEWPWLVSHYGV